MDLSRWLRKGASVLLVCSIMSLGGCRLSRYPLMRQCTYRNGAHEQVMLYQDGTWKQTVTATGGVTTTNTGRWAEVAGDEPGPMGAPAGEFDAYARLDGYTRPGAAAAATVQEPIDRYASVEEMHGALPVFMGSGGILLLVGLLLAAVWAVALVDAAYETFADPATRRMWLAIILVFSLPGALAYYAVGRRKVAHAGMVVQPKMG